MKRNNKKLALLGLLALLSSLPAAAGGGRRPAEEVRVPKVQIAILLDNSGSMSGLINQARTQLWRIVNEFTGAKQRGQPVRLELALYEYGERVKRISHFTQDLDKISSELFSLGIRGGDEYCGQVIQSATRELEWSGNPDDLKLIYIAGNEPFTQGPVHYKEAISEAKKKGILVNAIHCGGEDPTWRDGAAYAGGNFLMINHNAQVAQIVAPQDAEIARLGAEMNKTYLGYGAAGSASATRQAMQDKAAESAAPAAAAERAVAKSSGLYVNSTWDLVDGLKDGTVKLDQVREDDLPAEMRKMTKAEREAYISEKAKERAEIQKKIATLNEDRKRFLAEESTKRPAEASFDSEMLKSVREQGEARAFSF
ncbi:MAG: VWA domain-containing protein [Myxococcales bacterium]|nr:VWA domain-containing protein [Myxococcales bacterium]